MKSSQTKLNIFASILGLSVTALVVILSSSSETLSATIVQPVSTSTENIQTNSQNSNSVATAIEPPKTKPTITDNSSSTEIITTPPPEIVKNNSNYKNGTYTVTSEYQTPGSVEVMNVSLTINNDIVSDVSVSQTARNHDSRRYQNAFLSSYKQYVIGKKVDSISLSRVSGASLTTGGFNDALLQAKSQAQT